MAEKRLKLDYEDLIPLSPHLVQQWDTILQKVHYNSGTLYYRRYSTTVGHYTTEGTVQPWDTKLQKVKYNSGTLYYRWYSTIVGHYTTDGTVQ